MKNKKIVIALGAALLIAVGAFSYFGNGLFQGNLGLLGRANLGAQAEFIRNGLSPHLGIGAQKIYGFKVTTDANGALPQKLTFGFTAKVQGLDSICNFNIRDKVGQPQVAVVTDKSGLDIQNCEADITGNSKIVNEEINVNFMPGAIANLKPNTAYIYYLYATVGFNMGEEDANALRKISTNLKSIDGNNVALRNWGMNN